MKRPLTFTIILLLVAGLFYYLNVAGYFSRFKPGPQEPKTTEEAPAPKPKNTFLGLNWIEEGANLGEGALRAYTVPADINDKIISKQNSFTGVQWSAVSNEPISFRQLVEEKYLGEGWHIQERWNGYDIEAIAADGPDGWTLGFFKRAGENISLVVFSHHNQEFKMFVGHPKLVREILPQQVYR